MARNERPKRRKLKKLPAALAELFANIAEERAALEAEFPGEILGTSIELTDSGIELVPIFAPDMTIPRRELRHESGTPAPHHEPPPEDPGRPA